MDTYRNMSAEWWATEADRYCHLHIKAHQTIARYRAALEQIKSRETSSPDPDQTAAIIAAEALRDGER